MLFIGKPKGRSRMISNNHEFTWMTESQQTKSAEKSFQNRSCRFGLEISSCKIHPATGVRYSDIYIREFTNICTNTVTHKVSGLGLKMTSAEKLKSITSDKRAPK
jgi:hypothetical protein